MPHPLLIKSAGVPVTALVWPAAFATATAFPATYNAIMRSMYSIGKGGYGLGVQPFVEKVPSQSSIDAVIARKVLTLDTDQLRNLQIELVSDYLQEEHAKKKKKRKSDAREML